MRRIVRAALLGMAPVTAVIASPAHPGAGATVPVLRAPAVDGQPGDTLPSGTFVVRDVRLFDGEEVREGVTVRVEDGRVAEVGADRDVGDAAPVVDGRDRTLLPGLVDAHVHTFGPSALPQALAFGVTLQLDMFTSPELLARWRREQEEGGALGRADIRGAGFLATAPGGHGTQFGLPVPTLTSPDQAEAWVADRAEEGADFIKVILEDGRAHGMELPTLDDAVLAAVVRAAHERGLRAVAHVSTVADARRAVDAGADGLAHLWVDATPPAELVRDMVEAGTFVIPTLTVLERLRGRSAGGAGLLEEEGFPELLDAAARQGLERRFGTGRDGSWEPVDESIRALHSAGVAIVAGSDAPNPGTAYGASVHRELELLVASGLSPIEALRSATSIPARAFGFEDRGRIAPGARADLVLVEGDPTRDILASRRIVAVWKAGVRFDPEPVRAAVRASLRAAETAPAPAPENGTLPVSDFEDGTMEVAFGSGWAETTDAIMGGRSTVSLQVVEGGAEGSAHALRIAGEVAAGGPFAWAGAIYFPGPEPMQPVDLSGTRGFVFHVRGSGPAFQLFVFTRAGGQFPAMRPLAVDAVWREVFVPWEAFQGLDPSGLTGISIAAGPTPGAFEVLVDRVAFR